MTFRPLSPSSRSSGRDQSETRSLLAVDAESGRTWTFLLATGRYLHGKGVGGRGGVRFMYFISDFLQGLEGDIAVTADSDMYFATLVLKLQQHQLALGLGPGSGARMCNRNVWK